MSEVFCSDGSSPKTLMKISEVVDDVAIVGTDLFAIPRMRLFSMKQLQLIDKTLNFGFSVGMKY